MYSSIQYLILSNGDLTIYVMETSDKNEAAIDFAFIRSSDTKFGWTIKPRYDVNDRCKIVHVRIEEGKGRLDLSRYRSYDGYSPNLASDPNREFLYIFWRACYPPVRAMEGS